MDNISKVNNINNISYVGDWKDNKKDGYGIIVYDNKDKYEVFLINNHRGTGKMTWETKKVLTGYVSGKINTENFTLENGSKIKKMAKGFFSIKTAAATIGKILFIFRKWKNNKREGKGLMTYSNGEVYDGQWQDDLRHGYGILEK